MQIPIQKNPFFKHCVIYFLKDTCERRRQSYRENPFTSDLLILQAFNSRARAWVLLPSILCVLHFFHPLFALRCWFVYITSRSFVLCYISPRHHRRFVEIQANDGGYLSRFNILKRLSRVVGVRVTCETKLVVEWAKMFRSTRWRSEKNRIKAVFKLQFRASQVA